MRRIAFLLALMGLLAGVCQATCVNNAPTIQTRSGMGIAAINDCNWGTTLNNDFTILDTSACYQWTANTFQSTSTFNQPILLNNQPMRFYDASTHYIEFQSPSAVTTTQFKWPTSDGSANQVLQTNGAGILSWSAPGNASSLLSTTNTWTATQAFNSNTTLNNELDVNNGAGASGQILQSRGSALAPIWINSTSFGPGNTNYVQVTSVLQSGATFFVSSGTVNSQLTAKTFLLNGTSMYLNSAGSQYWGNLAGSGSASNQLCIGSGACLKDVSGNGDIGIGPSALGGAMNSGNNTAIGFGVLQSNTCTNNSNNTVLGTSAMASCTGGGAFANPGNVAIGYQTYTSMAPGGIGGSNTLIGNQVASLGATTMFEDVVMGYQAGLNYSSAHHMTTVGAFADSVTTGSANTDICIGHSACSGGEQGANNNIGPTTGSIFLGYSAGLDSTLGSVKKGINKSFAIGYQSYVGCSNCGVLGPNAGQYGDFHVGIDTNIPTYNLEVRGSSGVYASSLTIGNIASGTQCLHANANGQITGTGSDCGAGGGGDMILASTQTVTGGKTFLSSTTLNGTVVISTGIIMTYTNTQINASPTAFNSQFVDKGTGTVSIDGYFQCTGSSATQCTALTGTSAITNGNSYGVNGAATGSGTNYAGYFGASGGGSNYALWTYGGQEHFSDLTASRFVKTDASQNLTTTSLFGDTNTWTAGQTFISSVTVVSTFTASIITAVGSGNLSITENGITGQIVLSTAGASVTAGHCAYFSSSMTLVDAGAACGSGGGGGTPASPINSVQYNNGGSFGGSNNFQFNGTSITIVSSITLNTGGGGATTTNNPPGLFDIFSGVNTTYTGQPLLVVGGKDFQNQVTIPDHQAIQAHNYGIYAGGLHVGDIGNGLTQIVSDQSANSFIDFFNGSSGFTFQTGAAFLRDFTFNPETITTLVISSSALISNAQVNIQDTAANNTSYTLKVSSYTANFHVAVSTNGNIITNSSTTTMGTCGTSPSVTGDNNEGVITVGGGVVTACTLNFANGGWGTGCTVVCNESDNSTTVTGDISALSSTSVTFSFSATLGGGLIYYQCRGYGSACR
jgi:hypothetical protein